MQLSTSSDVVPVLLSPVLSRPVRSLSSCSHQYAFFRQPAISDSEPELSAVLGGAPLAVVPSSHSTAGLMAPSRGRKLRLSTSSRPSADSSGSLQTPPRSISPLALPPGVGGASGLVQPPLPHMSCCVATGLARHSPLSQSMSLLSK
ncbi:unnamed protein product, partial [Anisakis simplex]|uniref:Uncharacterized protein n=1 Tax=Anisakis simplex TaxID=6269 RepID=A0A0M3JLB8_ANISI